MDKQYIFTPIGKVYGKVVEENKDFLPHYIIDINLKVKTKKDFEKLKRFFKNTQFYSGAFSVAPRFVTLKYQNEIVKINCLKHEYIN